MLVISPRFLLSVGCKSKIGILKVSIVHIKKYRGNILIFSESIDYSWHSIGIVKHRPRKSTAY